VVYETKRIKTSRMNFRFHHDAVIGWDEKTMWTDRIRNYRTKPITFELHRQWPGHIDLESEVETKLFDYRTAKVTFKVQARSRALYPVTAVAHHGKNATQSRITLK